MIFLFSFFGIQTIKRKLALIDTQYVHGLFKRLQAVNHNNNSACLVTSIESRREFKESSNPATYLRGHFYFLDTVWGEAL